MAKKNEFAKRADDLLANRRNTVAALGELLDQKSEQEAQLADTNDRIEKAVAECLASGWTARELAEIGVPRANPRRTKSDKSRTNKPPVAQPAADTTPAAGPAATDDSTGSFA